ncbi:MAG: DNA-3-methyladenine glycosylase [Bacteroidota bacterium]|nr:DNA-3-methyladenine glycosylase [Bacteroidota bacterium]
MKKGKKLPKSFYLGDDVVGLSKALLGKFLVTYIEGEGRTSGMIVETEAYAGAIDKASHAYGNRMTPRTEVMYREGGIAYIYLIYGFHYMFNVISNVKGTPHAILVRAVEPAEGVEIMLRRRNMQEPLAKLSAGPGLVCKALGIDKSHNGLSLRGNDIFIEDRGIIVPEAKIIASPRVGIAYAAEHVALPWRFRVKDSAWTSRAK